MSTARIQEVLVGGLNRYQGWLGHVSRRVRISLVSEMVYHEGLRVKTTVHQFKEGTAELELNYEYKINKKRGAAGLI